MEDRIIALDPGIIPPELQPFFQFMALQPFEEVITEKVAMELFERHAATAQSILEKEGEVSPQIFILAPNPFTSIPGVAGEEVNLAEFKSMIFIIPVGPFMESGASKDLLSSWVRGMAAKLNAYAVIQVNEAWYREMSPEELDDDKSVSEYEDRQETIWCNIETKASTRIRNVLFERDSTGKPVVTEVKDSKDFKGSFTSEGRMSNWIPNKLN